MILYRDIKVDLYTAILGDKINVDTMKGKLQVSIKAGTQNGASLRLKGMGMPIQTAHGTFGDLYVKVNVLLPTNLSEKEVEIFKQLSDLEKART